MKMKNMLIGGMSLALVACISIGATLAYLTDKTGPVTNTFYGSAGIKMTLDEAPVDPDTGKVTSGDRRTQNTYNNITPNAEVDKDPTVHMVTVPETGADLFVRVSGVTSEMQITMETNWNKVANVDGSTALDGTVNGIYKWNGTEITTADDYLVFDGVTFTNYDVSDGTTKTFTPIEVIAYAVQNDNLATGDTTQSLAINALKVVNPGA